MSVERIPASTLAEYAAVGADARTRYNAGDSNLSEAESSAIASLCAALKNAGIVSPIDLLIDAGVNPNSWRGYSSRTAAEVAAAAG